MMEVEISSTVRTVYDVETMWVRDRLRAGVEAGVPQDVDDRGPGHRPDAGFFNSPRMRE